MTQKPVAQPVVSDLARQWLDGKITAEDYFAQCRATAEAEARAHVAARLKRRQET